jgi:hypothetical protein
MVPLPALLGLFFAGVVPREPLVCTVTPQVIPVGAFYNGAEVKIEGGVAARSKVIVTVTGSDHETVFNKKARFGPIWVNSGKVRISGVPSLFLRFSSAPPASMLARSVIAQHHLDESTMTQNMHIEPRPKDARTEAALRADYLALKKGDGTYVIGRGGVRVSEASAQARFVLQFRWPKHAPPGEYAVRVYEINDGAVVRQAELPVTVVRTGFPAWLAGLAASRASLYGITAILIGGLAGFGIDFLTTFLFGKKRSVSR